MCFYRLHLEEAVTRKLPAKESFLNFENRRLIRFDFRDVIVQKFKEERRKFSKT